MGPSSSKPTSCHGRPTNVEATRALRSVLPGTKAWNSVQFCGFINVTLIKLLAGSMLTKTDLSQVLDPVTKE